MRYDARSDQSGEVDRIMTAMHKATTISNCVSSFVRAGMSPERRSDGHYDIRVDIGMARCLRRQPNAEAGVPGEPAPTAEELFPRGNARCPFSPGTGSRLTRGQQQVRNPQEAEADLLRQQANGAAEAIGHDIDAGEGNADRVLRSTNVSEREENATQQESPSHSTGDLRPELSIDRYVPDESPRVARGARSQAVRVPPRPEWLIPPLPLPSHLLPECITNPTRAQIATSKCNINLWSQTQVLRYMRQTTPPSPADILWYRDLHGPAYFRTGMISSTSRSALEALVPTLRGLGEGN
jgi:hypothetical protein